MPGEQTAGPGTAMGSVYLTGNLLQFLLPVGAGPRTPAGSAHPPVCQQVVYKCQALGIPARALSDTRTVTARNHAQKRQNLK